MSNKENSQADHKKLPSVETKDREHLKEMLKESPDSIVNLIKRSKPKLKKEDLEIILKEIIIEQKSVRQYSGPIPDAGELQSYEDIKKGFADRIMVMAEKRQEHVQKMDEEHIKTSGKLATRELSISDGNSKRGMYSALFLATFLMLIAVWVISLKEVVIGSGLITANLVSLVTVYILGTKTKKYLKYKPTDESTKDDESKDTSPPQN